ncbi:hypothetical protein Pla110_01580 [Polystyrenella longa]|uniref:Uncharacterized protein n=1 Tax=Polystyrenella longa TaxID=2528007 RepID=A0A518CH07_9PLAN|nr:hypothetical protein Pla110_01580 [Polystyrenella longa]
MPKSVGDAWDGTMAAGINEIASSNTRARKMRNELKPECAQRLSRKGPEPLARFDWT